MRYCMCRSICCMLDSSISCCCCCCIIWSWSMMRYCMCRSICCMLDSSISCCCCRCLHHLVLVHDAVLHVSIHLLHVGLVHQLLLLPLPLLHPTVAVHSAEQSVPVVCHLLVF